MEWWKIRRIEKRGRDRKMRGWKILRRKWKDEKLICLVKKKNEIIENKVGINQWRS